jgi:excisionase family DNA binding protein
MGARFELDSETINQLAFELAEILKPLLLNGMPGREDELLNTSEAAKLLRVGEGQIYQWTNKAKHGLGSFPYFKTGKQLRFSKKDLLEWLKSNKNG